MSATVNSDGIDLNSDFDSVDRENEPHGGDGVSGSAICVGVVETETVMGPMNGPGLSNDGLEGDMDSVDRVKRIVDNRGVDYEVGNVGTLSVMGGEIRVKCVEGREGGGDIDFGKSDRVVENVGVVVEGEVINVINGDYSSGVGAGREHGKSNHMEVDAGLGDAMCMGTRIAEEDVSDPSKVVDVSHNALVVVASEILESRTVIESVEAKTEYNKETNIGFVDVTEAGVSHTDDSVPDQDPDVNVNVELGRRIVDNRGVDYEVGNVGTLPVMGGEIRVKCVEGREVGCDIDCGKSDRAVENVGEVIGVIYGDYSSGVGAGRGHADGISMLVDDDLGDAMCMGTVISEDVSDPSKVVDVSHNVPVLVASKMLESRTMEESVETKTEYDRAMNFDVDVRSVPDQVPGANVDVSVLLTSETVANQATVNVKSKTEDNEKVSIDVLGLGVPEITGREFNRFNLVVDLDSCMDRKGNSKSLDGIDIERTNLKYISLGEHAPRHDNGIVSSGNPYKTSDGWSKHNGKKNRKLVSAKACASSDLVWGKVRSHPWWPGIIFDPSAATKKARKYYKKNSFLIAYFGDQTFAWNEASRIKPFSVHFSQMENQSNSEDFQYAVDCALDEVSRRVEFGLACSCLPEDLVGSIESQIIVNAGIQKESSRIYGGDRFHGPDSVKPRKLIRYLKTLAVFPYSEIDRLEHIISQAQVLAFYRSKGYCQLPEFTMLGRLLEEDEEFIFPDNREHSDTGDEKQVTSGKENRKCPDGSSRKRKNISGSLTNPGKKQKSLSELMGSRCLDSSNDDNASRKMVGAQLISWSSKKKRKAVDSTPDDSAVKLRKTDLCASSNANSDQSFSVGTAPVIGYCESLLNNIKKPTGDSFVSACSPKNSEESHNTNFIPTEYCAPDEMLSRLWLAAKDPTKEYSFTISVLGFFSEFRSSVNMDPADFEKLSDDAGESELCMEDAHLAKRMVQSKPEEQKSEGNLNDLGKCTLAIPSDKATQESGAVNPAARMDENCKEEASLAALILNFTNLDSIPSITNLNRIYSQFGPLIESQTEVLKKSNRAKVVFKRRSDAETAFSSAGKYKIFGPSLVSYSLKYLPSTPSKASPRAKKKNRKDATYQPPVKKMTDQL